MFIFLSLLHNTVDAKRQYSSYFKSYTQAFISFSHFIFHSVQQFKNLPGPTSSLINAIMAALDGADLLNKHFKFETN